MKRLSLVIVSWKLGLALLAALAVSLVAAGYWLAEARSPGADCHPGNVLVPGSYLPQERNCDIKTVDKIDIGEDKFQIVEFGPTHIEQAIYYKFDDLGSDGKFCICVLASCLEDKDHFPICNPHDPVNYPVFIDRNTTRLEGTFRDDGRTKYRLIKLIDENSGDILTKGSVYLSRGADISNDTCSYATGKISLGAPYNTQNSSEFTGDEDWFQLPVTVPANETHALLRVYMSGIGQFDLEMMDGACTTLLTTASTNQGTEVALAAAQVQAGVYRIGVTGAGIGPYAIRSDILVDKTNPTVTFENVGGVPYTVYARVQDKDSGLAEISMNCKFLTPILGEFDVNVPAFVRGTTQEVVIRGFTRNIPRGSRFQCGVWARDLAGVSKWDLFEGLIAGEQVSPGLFLPVVVH